MAQLSSLLWYLRAARGLDRLFRHPVGLDAGEARIRHRLATREARFLAVVQRLIYQQVRSPYLPLLRRAGCTLGDLQAMVEDRGLEPTLRALRDQGVYFSFEEFKGRVDVRRGELSFRLAERDFDNPLTLDTVDLRTGASRSRGMRVPVSLKIVQDQIQPYLQQTLQAFGMLGHPLILWTPGLPAPSGVFITLGFTPLGRAPVRWFALTNPADPVVGRRHRILVRMARVLIRRYGRTLPPLEYVPVTAAEVVLTAMAAVLRAHGACTVITSPSAAVRLAGLALRQGLSLQGVCFLTTSEPLTPAKAREIRRAGAVVGSVYGFTEGGLVAMPCAHPTADDDMHVMTDAYGMILHRREVPGLGALEAFMFTSLLDSTPKVMLNVEIDDFGPVAVRRCACALGALGLDHHVAEVRSFTKLTGEGSTVLGTDCVRILEEVLPREFGGRSIDYQLLEAEDEQHLTRLHLLISPEVGALDERRVLQRLYEELRRARAAGLRLWTPDDTIRVVRRPPVATPRGKILPFHTLGVGTDGTRVAGLAPEHGDVPLGVPPASPRRMPPSEPERIPRHDEEEPHGP